MSAHNDKDTAPLAALNLPKPSTDVKAEQSSAVAASEDDPDAVPELKTASIPPRDDDSRVEALHMVADSVAQQRNIGARTIIYHPVMLGVLGIVLAGLHQAFTKNGETDWIRVATSFTGAIMIIFVSVRWTCGGYIFEAERVGTWKWLDQGRSATEEEESGVKVLGDADEVLITRFGKQYIGTIVFRGVQSVSPSSSKKGRKSQSSANQPKMLIRAWTVVQKYRRKGVGSALIDDALKVGHEKGWTAGGVEFADDHANHLRVLPTMFNGGYEKQDRAAKKILENRLNEFEANLDSKGRKKR